MQNDVGNLRRIKTGHTGAIQKGLGDFEFLCCGRQTFNANFHLISIHIFKKQTRFSACCARTLKPQNNGRRRIKGIVAKTDNNAGKTAVSKIRAVSEIKIKIKCIITRLIKCRYRIQRPAGAGILTIDRARLQDAKDRLMGRKIRHRIGCFFCHRIKEEIPPIDINFGTCHLAFEHKRNNRHLGQINTGRGFQFGHHGLTDGPLFAKTRNIHKLRRGPLAVLVRKFQINFI